MNNMQDDFQQEYAKIKAAIPPTEVACTFDALKENIGTRPLVIYAAGRLAGVFLDFCKERGIVVSRICDRYVQGRFGSENIPIIDLQTLKNDYADAVVLISSHTFKDEIYASLKEMGFDHEQIIPCPVQYPCFQSLSTFSQYLDGYAWAYDFFQDTRSKQLIMDKIRLLLLDKPLEPNTTCENYYEDCIALGENEVFIDGGAFWGDSAEAFLQKAKNVRHIYSFEPDPQNYERALQNLSHYSHVDVLAKGLWSVETELDFFPNHANAPGSTFVIIPSGSKMQTVSVISLDAFFAGKPNSELPTFIKMDIEGAEKEALLGAADIIRRAKPKLAICAYHKIEDIYELPRTLLTLRGDYKLVLRQHALGWMETILYAV